MELPVGFSQFFGGLGLELLCRRAGLGNDCLGFVLDRSQTLADLGCLGLGAGLDIPGHNYWPAIVADDLTLAVDNEDRRRTERRCNTSSIIRNTNRR